MFDSGHKHASRKAGRHACAGMSSMPAQVIATSAFSKLARGVSRSKSKVLLHAV